MAYSQMAESGKQEEEEEKKELILAKDLKRIGVDLSIVKFKPTFAVCNLILQIDNQNTFSGYIYDEFCKRSDIFGHPPELSRDEFIRIWKSCLLIRSQELNTKLGDNMYLNNRWLIKPAYVPVPLAHLLKALGRSECPATGIIVDVIPPPLDASNLPNWAVKDVAVVNRWNEFMTKIHNYFHYFEIHSTYPFRSSADCEYFPSMQDYDGKSIGLTALKVDTNGTLVRSISHVPRGSDVLIRICNDELFVETVHPFERMVAQFGNEFDAEILRRNYFIQFYGVNREYDTISQRLDIMETELSRMMGKKLDDIPDVRST